MRGRRARGHRSLRRALLPTPRWKRGPRIPSTGGARRSQSSAAHCCSATRQCTTGTRSSTPTRAPI
jgi:hypothetical protein